MASPQTNPQYEAWQDACADYRSSGGESASDYSDDGFKIGEEAFLTVDPAGWRSFIDAAAEEEGQGNLDRTRVIATAAEYELATLVALASVQAPAVREAA